MAISFFTGIKRIATLPIDVVTRESYSMTASVTNYPIEDGSSIQDNVVNDLKTITLDCFISNTPIGIQGSISIVQNLGFNQGLSAYNFIEELWRKKTIVTIVTGLKQFENMKIVSFTPTRTVNNSQGLAFTISLVQVNIVTSRVLTNSNSNLGGDLDTQRRSGVESDLGKSATFQQSAQVTNTEIIQSAIK